MLNKKLRCYVRVRWPPLLPEPRPRSFAGTRTDSGTIDKYLNVLRSFIRSLETYQNTHILANLTPQVVSRWVPNQRAQTLSEYGIASRLSALKVFSNGCVCKRLELTTVDLLRKVPRIAPPEKPMAGLTKDQLGTLFDYFDRPTCG